MRSFGYGLILALSFGTQAIAADSTAANAQDVVFKTTTPGTEGFDSGFIYRNESQIDYLLNLFPNKQIVIDDWLHYENGSIGKNVRGTISGDGKSVTGFSFVYNAFGQVAGTTSCGTLSWNVNEKAWVGSCTYQTLTADWATTKTTTTGNVALSLESVDRNNYGFTLYPAVGTVAEHAVPFNFGSKTSKYGFAHAKIRK